MEQDDDSILAAGMDPAAVDAFLGVGSAQVRQFHDMLADQGVLRGLIGPREVPRLWQRHLLNCAAVAHLLPSAGRVVDVGSGAGLPGVVLAAMAPQLEIVLVEPMERRCLWLQEVVETLRLPNTSVVRGRSADVASTLRADVVTARAVAALETLVPWTMPLLGAGGILLAMKGSRAEQEVAEAGPALAAWGAGAPEILLAATPAGVEETRVVRIVRETGAAPPRTARPRPRAARRGEGRGGTTRA